jgi:hypothetical protein
LYTQRIERLGAQLWAIILAGLTIAAAAARWDYNAGRAGITSPQHFGLRDSAQPNTTRERKP